MGQAWASYSDGRGLEVLIVMHEVGLVLPVDLLTGLLHVLGHPWGAAAEHTDLPHLGREEKQRGV